MAAAASVLIVTAVFWRAGREREFPLSPSEVASFALAPGIVRSAGQSAEVTIRQDNSEVRLPLETAKADPRLAWRARLRLVDGTEIVQLKLGDVTAESGISVHLPASSLTEGDYIIELESTGPTEEYQLRESYFMRLQKNCKRNSALCQLFTESTLNNSVTSCNLDHF